MKCKGYFLAPVRLVNSGIHTCRECGAQFEPSQLKDWYGSRVIPIHEHARHRLTAHAEATFKAGPL